MSNKYDSDMTQYMFDKLYIFTLDSIQNQGKIVGIHVKCNKCGKILYKDVDGDVAEKLLDEIPIKCVCGNVISYELTMIDISELSKLNEQQTEKQNG